jgi:hypothetical protein
MAVPGTPRLFSFVDSETPPGGLSFKYFLVCRYGAVTFP